MAYEFNKAVTTAISNINTLEVENQKNDTSIAQQIYLVAKNRNGIKSTDFHVDNYANDKSDKATQFVARCILSDNELKFYLMDSDERKRVKKEEFDGQPITVESNSGKSKTVRRIDNDVNGARPKYKVRFEKAELAIAKDDHDLAELTRQSEDPSYEKVPFKAPKKERAIVSNKDFLLTKLSDIGKRLEDDKTNDDKFGIIEVETCNELIKHLNEMIELLKKPVTEITG